jgi:hypothetical protein
LAFFRRTIAPDVSTTKRLTLELDGFGNSSDYAIGYAVDGSSIVLSPRACTDYEEARW